MKIDREKTNVTCQNPKCGKDIEIKYQDFWNGSREARCRRCGATMRFDSNLASRARSSAQDLERSQDKFDKALEQLMSEKLELTLR